MSKLSSLQYELSRTKEALAEAQKDAKEARAYKDEITYLRGLVQKFMLGDDRKVGILDYFFNQPRS